MRFLGKGSWIAAASIIVVTAAGTTAFASTPNKPSRPSPSLQTGTCSPSDSQGVIHVPQTVRAGDVITLTCGPSGSKLINLVPIFDDSFAEPTYVLRPVEDYSWVVDRPSGSNAVLVRILRDINPGFPTTQDYALLLTYVSI